jgi:hypothetical protein
VVPQGFVVLFPVVLGGDFWSPLLGGFLGLFSGPWSWGFDWGNEDHVWFEDRWMVASLCDE